jgi:hypothetical protein
LLLKQQKVKRERCVEHDVGVAKGACLTGCPNSPRPFTTCVAMTMVGRWRAARAADLRLDEEEL